MRTKLLAVCFASVLLWFGRVEAACKTTSTTTTTTTTSTTTTTLSGALYKDLFERAGTDMGTDWSPLSASYDALAIYNSSDVSCLVATCTTGNTENLSYWDTAGFTSAASYACINLLDGTMSADIYLGACLVDPSSTDAVCCIANLGTTDQWQMAKFDSGTFSNVTALATQAWATGDSIAIARTGAATYQCYLDPTGAPIAYSTLGTEQTVANTGGFSISTSAFNAGVYHWGAVGTGDTGAGVIDGVEAWEASATATPLTGAVCGSN